MTPIQQQYLEKLRSAFENSAHGEEMVYILGNMRRDLSAAEFQMVITTFQNSRP